VSGTSFRRDWDFPPVSAVENAQLAWFCTAELEISPVSAVENTQLAWFCTAELVFS
jgi:hypothetical protein